MPCRWIICLTASLLAAFLPGIIVCVARGGRWARISGKLWRSRRREGSHAHAAWRTRVYDMRHFRGESRDDAFRYSTRCEWVTAARAALYLGCAVVLLAAPVWIAKAISHACSR